MEQQARCYALLRRQRHSLLNHLQVISGWLQLNQPDRARAYLDGLAAQWSAESELLRRLPPALGLVTADLMMEAECLGLQVEWRLAGEQAGVGESSSAGEPAGWQLERMAAQAAVELLRVSSLPGEVRRAVVVVGPGGFRVHTPPGEGEG